MKRILTPTVIVVLLMGIGFMWITCILPSIQTQTLPNAITQTLGSCVHVTNVTRGIQGSAFAIAPDILVTARHVIDGGEEFLVTTVGGVECTAHQAISSKKYDIGFIRLDGPVLTPAKTGNIEDLRLGEAVYVIGGSLGKMNWPNITAGIVSCLDRDLESFGAPENYGWSILWQVDAAAYPGNSGGPIFTLDGVARGILVSGMRNTECLSYCVPLDIAVPDLAVIRLLFIGDEYEVEEVPDEPDYRFDNVYSWFIENEEFLTYLRQVVVFPDMVN